jgi:hypothetical protein
MVGWRVYFGLRNVISGEQPSAAAGSPCPTAPHANVPFRSSPAFALPTTRKPFQASPFLPDSVAILVRSHSVTLLCCSGCNLASCHYRDYLLAWPSNKIARCTAKFFHPVRTDGIYCRFVCSVADRAGHALAICTAPRDRSEDPKARS